MVCSVKESLEGYMRCMNNRPPFKSTSFVFHVVHYVSPSPKSQNPPKSIKTEEHMTCCPWTCPLRGLDDESRETSDETDGSGTRTELVGAVDSDNTRSSGRTHGSVGGTSGRSDESGGGGGSGGAAEIRGSRHEGGRRRNTSNGRHACAGRVGDCGRRATSRSAR